MYLLSSPLLAADSSWRSPETVAGATTIDAATAKRLYDEGAVFIDVRNPRLYAKKHIPRAHHLDLKNGFDEQAVNAIADVQTPIVIYCSGVKCGRSYRAAARAVDWGYTRVQYFRGGIVAWKDAGYPLEKAEGE